MHFSIPDTQEFNHDSGSNYMGYNIHINGMYHCTVRYKQLHNLNDQLKKVHGSSSIPPFPPKKLLQLSNNQLEERRALLEKYIQTVGQSPHLMNTEIFQGFLLSAQSESSNEKYEEVPIDIFLMNGFRTTINALTNDRTDHILEKVCCQINLPLKFMYYFCLFLIKREDSGDIVIVRRLQNFECPYISQKTINENTRIVLRKSYWDPAYDQDLISDKTCLNLIYTQAVSDIERGWIYCSKDTQSQLSSLQARGAKKEYIELAQTLKYYGYTQFKACTCDYPVPGCQCIVSAGSRELNLRVKLASGQMKEGSFKVTRMRCWRITTHNEMVENSNDEENNKDDIDFEKKLPSLQLSFEYLMAKDKLQWISIFSDQAILMSVCLQSMVDELLLKKSGSEIKQPSDNCKTESFSYMKRDGSNHQICLSQSNSSDCLSCPYGHMKSPSKTEPTLSMKKLTEKLSSVSLKAKVPPLVENDAFEGIGDEDL